MRIISFTCFYLSILKVDNHEEECGPEFEVCQQIQFDGTLRQSYMIEVAPEVSVATQDEKDVVFNVLIDCRQKQKTNYENDEAERRKHHIQNLLDNNHSFTEFVVPCTFFDDLSDPHFVN